MHIDVHDVKERARGQWPAMLTTLGGIAPELLDGKHHPCPKCGGNDRFRLIDADAGAVLCNVCFKEKNGDGLAALLWATGQDFPTVVKLAAEYLGVTPRSNGNGKPATFDPLSWLANLKAVSVDSLRAYGAKVQGNKLIFPTYDGEGNRISSQEYFPGDEKGEKGKIPRGGTHGLFLPHDEAGIVIQPKPGETWTMHEGVKDCAAMWMRGYRSVGMPTNGLAGKFASMFHGVHIVYFPDRDKGGDEGRDKTGAMLRGFVASVKVAVLPLEWKETGGPDVRDAFQLRDGEAVVRNAFEKAQPWQPRQREPGDESDVEVQFPGEPTSQYQTHAANGRARGTADEARKREPIEYKLITCAELASNDYTVDYLCTSIMAAQQPMIIGALQKTLKTSVALDLAIALATSGCFLGFFKVRRPVSVVFMSGESGMSAIKSTAQAICTAVGVELASIENLWLSSALPKIGHPEHMLALEQMLLKSAAKVLFIDPVYLAMPATDSNNLFATGELLREVSEICQRLGVTLVLIHHLKKSAANKDGPVDLSDLSWSGYGEFARQWILISRREPYEHGRPHFLELVAGGSEGHGAHVAVDIDFGPFEPGQSRKWDVLVQDLAEARQVVNKRKADQKADRAKEKLAADVETLLTTARRFPSGETKSVLKDTSGIYDTRFKAALVEALRQGRLESCELLKGNQKTPRDGFKVSNGMDQSGQSG